MAPARHPPCARRARPQSPNHRRATIAPLPFLRPQGRMAMMLAFHISLQKLKLKTVKEKDQRDIRESVRESMLLQSS
jgi:hypothetical protein